MVHGRRGHVVEPKPMQRRVVARCFHLVFTTGIAHHIAPILIQGGIHVVHHHLELDPRRGVLIWNLDGAAVKILAAILTAAAVHMVALGTQQHRLAPADVARLTPIRHVRSAHTDLVQRRIEILESLHVHSNPHDEMTVVGLVGRLVQFCFFLPTVDKHQIQLGVGRRDHQLTIAAGRGRVALPALMFPLCSGPDAVVGVGVEFELDGGACGKFRRALPVIARHMLQQYR